MTRLAVLTLLAGMFLSTSYVVPREATDSAAPAQVEKASAYDTAAGKVMLR